MISAIGNAGFTLLELLVVLAILVLMAAAWPYAAPRLFPAQQLRNETQHLLSSIQLARLVARETGAPQAIAIADDGESYQSPHEMHNLANGIALRLRGHSSTTQDAIIFFPDGSSSGGILDLTLPTRTVSVEIGYVTGHTSVLE